MGETPYGPFSDGRLPGGGPPRIPQQRPWQRSFRCPASIPPPIGLAPASRFDDFLALHESLSSRPQVSLRRLWLCGLGVAVLAAVTVFAGVLALRSLLGIEVPAGSGGMTAEAAATTYGVCALAATVQATALLHVLIAVAARPIRAFCWIGGLAVLLVTILPLTLRGAWDVALATGALNLVGGAGAVALLAVVAAASLRHPGPPRPPRSPAPPGPKPPPFLPGGW
ncbi:hypothetical protein [Spirillospora sp. NPDC047279]|uniref:hypothetical protein n=1 Tax=Spirillospora sp. NPDC047279 TaxID=3155478 RepID=UPI0033F5B2A6